MHDGAAHGPVPADAFTPGNVWHRPPAAIGFHRSVPEHAGERRLRGMKATSCGVLVTDGTRLLLGHATRSPRWDIPKGLAEPGEDFAEAAVRELREETGLEAAPAVLVRRGIHRYRPGKDLALFEWRPAVMPDPATLQCTSHFAVGKTLLPEFDRFGLFDWSEALSRVGRNMARVLTSVREGLFG
jgi:8-oxo-dGTP pyrophosphatase MutT (NUDIX family)